MNFTIKSGEFVTIFGPNGAGKTTLIRILATISKASAGHASIGGFLLQKEPEKIRGQIGVIAHQTFLYGDLTAEENLLFFAKLYEIENRKQRVNSLITEVGLGLRRLDRVRTFSRGMQQRLSIARAMLHDPAVLLLDEPYTGLDQHASDMLSNWLKKLKDSRRTILMVTHDLEQGIDLAERIAVLVRGVIVLDKNKSALDLNNFRELYNTLVEEGGRRA